MKKIKIKTGNSSPNFTIILPGTCQASCEFCYWKEDKNTKSFLKSLKKVLKLLPDNFTQISISGGEPTLSPVFKQTLDLLKKHRQQFNKVVLTTNGLNLTKYDLSGIDHINISRHCYDDTINRSIFKTNKVPSTEELCEIINYVNKFGIDVNINAVKNNIDYSINEWSKFLKKIGASSISFRNQYDDYSDHPIKTSLMRLGYDYKSVSSCPVCLTEVFIYKGVVMKFHSSDYEPILSDAFDKDEVYEVILQQNGDLTRDWEAKKILKKGHMPKA